ncbi:unnamed protein product [Orchesella dallaii]|uniref:Integrase catalytic domain-containing protein n=1 Tax=Orchesella dallaii TaxID=48710 RepID=A0ABP1RD73_9HEXA
MPGTSPTQAAEIDRTAQTLNIAILESKVANDNIRPMSAAAAKQAMKLGYEVRGVLYDIHTRILNQQPEEDELERHEAEHTSLNERLLNALSCLQEILDRETAPPPPDPFAVPPAPLPPVAPAAPQPHHIKLPQMQLPTFNGRYEDWPSFEDLFTATIHKTSLSGSQKLQYLKSCLKGDPEALIRSFTITNANYDEAWDMLKDRYANKREIVYSLLRKIINQPTLKTESSSSLQSLLCNLYEALRSLKVIGRSVEHWDDIISVIVIDKLDPDTKSEWARTLKDLEIPKLEDIFKFLDSHIRSIEARGTVATKVNLNNNAKPLPGQRRKTSHFSSSSPPSCLMCKGDHYLFKCSKLLELQPPQRMSAVKHLRACLNCLREGHTYQRCNSRSRCRHCAKPHHTVLHFPSETPPLPPLIPDDKPLDNKVPEKTDAAKASTSSSSTVRAHVTSAFDVTILLKTAIVNVKDNFGNTQQLRALLDEGSEASFIREESMKALGLPRSKADVIIEGVTATTVSHARWAVSTRLESRVCDAGIDVELLALKQITGMQPKLSFDPTIWDHIQGLQLADPTFFQPSDIDILLGADVVPYVMRNGRKEGSPNSPVAQDSIFGWVLAGKVTTSQRIVSSHFTRASFDEIIQRFWEVEDVPSKRPYSPEETACESHFVTTHYRKPDGRYVVQLPFNCNSPTVGETRGLAVNRLLALERRFKKHPQYHEAYQKFMEEYLDLGHMELVTSTNSAVQPVYIPHHFVIKDDSTTTKLRVVFDASMKSDVGTSLNDVLLVGPTIQDDIFNILLRFRTHHVALKADITKMYRQFEVHEEDRDYQRILWRDNLNNPIMEYRLKTVTYGTACAPFLATRCLNQLATDEEKEFPTAAKVIKQDMYVDDLVGGETSTTTAIKLVNELTLLCTRGGLEIRKWCSSHPDVLSAIPEHLQEMEASDFDVDSTVKTLGVRWNPSGDYFFFAISLPQQLQSTKRSILSEIAKTYDPIGWLTPITITAKILLQDLWRTDVGWDDCIHSDKLEEWQNYQQQLPQLSSIHIPRCVIPPETHQFQLHGFSDASEKAYAAAVYLRCLQNNAIVTVHLLASKSKVAPLKQVSLPRLELCAAHLLCNLIESWISSPSRKWKTFVANRVAAIQDVIPPQQWQHVISQDNPADLPSRGISPHELDGNSLWWHGPSWLSTDKFPFSTATTDEEEVVKEAKGKAFAGVSSIPIQCQILDTILEASSLHKVIATAAWLQRYILYLKDARACSRGPLAPSERKGALHTIIRLIQKSVFYMELRSLERKTAIPTTSKLSSLRPFIDEEGILRVGGRLQNAPIQASSKHPIILPGRHFFTVLLIERYHHTCLHGGFSLVLSLLRRKYWIINGRDVVRFTLRKCVTCKCAQPTAEQQLMGNLPAARVTPNRPFLHCGVDFAGPFFVSMRKGRGIRPDKCYMAIFVCFSTKAVHLEAVTSLSTEAFIACYRRFVARRGVCSHLYSDCGTNFVGADRALKKLLEEANNQIQQQLSLSGTKWVFNPPSAPHQGGLWEAGVKSAKYHIKRVVGSRILSLEQFNTLLCNVESCLNSRPLCVLSSDPTDTDALTPGHFLIGEPLTSVPEPDISMMNIERLDHWKQVQHMSQHFWKRWQEEYLSTLQQRAKWIKQRDNLEVGDLVVVREDVISPNKWRMGRIIATHPGQDGLVRKATVKTATGAIIRPIQKLSLILSNNEN